MRLTFLLSLFLLSWIGIKAQNIGINDDGSSPNTNAILDVKSNSKGLLLPRLTTAQRTTLGGSLGSTEAGMIIFDTTLRAFYFWTGTIWKETGKNISALLKDADADTKIQVEETADEDIIRFDIGGVERWVMTGNRLEPKNMDGAIFIGEGAGENVVSNNNNIFLGKEAGNGSTNGGWNIGLGYQSLSSNGHGTGNISLGYQSLKNLAHSSGNIALGTNAMYDAVGSSNNVALGHEVNRQNVGGDNNVMLGAYAGFKNNSSNNIFIGYQAGYNTIFNNNIFIGYQAGYNETASSKLYIENSNSSNPLIYGDFNSDLIRINGTLTSTGAFQSGYQGTDGSVNIFSEQGATDYMLTFQPHAAMSQNVVFTFPADDGTANQVLQTDGSGSLSWTNATTDTDDQNLSLSGNTLNISDGTGVDLTSFKDNTDAQSLSVSGSNLAVSGGNSIDLNTAEIKLLQDNDNDTKIQVEETADEDIIRFDIGGNEKWLMRGNRLEQINAGNSLFIGLEAGVNDDLTNNQNVFLGYRAGKFNTTGQFNTAVGRGTFESNTTGSENTAIGNYALFANNSGWYNVALGRSAAGANTIGSRNISIGRDANSLNQTGNNNTIIGYEAGKGTANHNKSGNVFLGFQSGYFETGDDKLYIENSSSTTPLIYGEFDNNLLRVNGTLNVNNAFSFPTTDGTLNQVLVTDGSGNVSWANATTDTDDQNLSLSGNTLNISDGTGVDLTSFKDNTDAQNLSLSGNTLNIAGGTGVNLTSFKDNTDAQDLSISGNTLSLTNDGTTVDLSGYLDNTDAQTLSVSGSNLAVSGGNSIDLNTVEIKLLQDNDNDTKIQVEESADEDIIRFDIGGNEKWLMRGNRLEQINAGNSLFIGLEAGVNDDLTNNQNVFLGYRAGKFNTTGQFNTAVGRGTFESNTTGSENTAIGNYALFGNISGWYNVALGRSAAGANTIGSRNISIGRDANSLNQTGNNNTIIGYEAGKGTANHNKSGNVFLGFQSGYFETGDDKLYIENSSSATPLIYGEFDNNLLRVNGTLNINNAFSFPTADGTANQVLATDGSGALSWTNATTDTDDQNLSLSGNTLNISDGTGVDLTSFKDNTDAQDLSLSGNTLSLTNDGTAVDLAPYLDNTDTQTLTSESDSITISNGNKVVLKVSQLGDTDADTKIQVEESGDEDVIRFDIAGTERWAMDGSRLEAINTGASTFIGEDAGLNDNLSNNRNTAIGHLALSTNTTGNNNVALGSNAMRSASGGFNNVATGNSSLFYVTGFGNTAYGMQSLEFTTSGSRNVAMGNTTLNSNITGGNNVALGFDAGFNTLGSNNIFLGYQAGFSETGSNKLYIENSNSASPLIYGDFAADSIQINGKLNINGAFNLPTADGTTGQVIATDGAGNLSWANSLATSSLSDADNDTKVHVEKTADDDLIRFDIAGSERWTFTDGVMIPKTVNGHIAIGKSITNTGGAGNIAIGDGSGTKAVLSIHIGSASGSNSTGWYNVAIGSGALSNNTGGINARNVAIGLQTLLSNTKDKNVAIGAEAVFQNINGAGITALGFRAGGLFLGDSSVFIGHEAGYNATGSHKLYIDINGTNSPLLYGEFDNDSLQVNGNMEVTQDLNVLGDLTFGGDLEIAAALNVPQNLSVGTSATFGTSGSFGTTGSFGTGLYVGSAGVDGFLALRHVDKFLYLTPNDNMTTNLTFEFPVSYGSSGNFLTSDGAGELSWVDGYQDLTLSGTSLSISSGNSADLSTFHQSLSLSGDVLSIANGNNVDLSALSKTLIEDADNDTKIQVEESADEDAIRFDLGGTEQLTVSKNGSGRTQIYFPNNLDNVSIGSGAGFGISTGSRNVTVGTSAGASIGNKARNVMVGYEAGVSNGAHNNTFIGHQAGKANTIGTSNTFLGESAGLSNSTGASNTFVGRQAAELNFNGSNNTVMGHEAGKTNANGSGNVFLGYQAGYNETSSDKLYIENSNATTPLIYGEFNYNLVGINRVATTNTFEVGGTASKATAGDWLANSDARLKKNINPLKSSDVLNKLLSLKGITYEWNDDKTGNERPEGIQYGFTAQNIQKVFPTLVSEDNLGYLQTAYGTYDAMYVEAIRALNEKIEENKKMKNDIEELKTKSAELKVKNEELEASLQAVLEMQKKIDEIDRRLKETETKSQTLVKGN